MATALELSRDGWTSYLAAARRRPTPPPLDRGEGGGRDALFPVSARWPPNCGRASARAAWFARDSDIDLAVEGVDPGQYWEAWRVAEAIIPDRPVDLVELETAGEGLRRAIDRYGLDL